MSSNFDNFEKFCTLNGLSIEPVENTKWKVKMPDDNVAYIVDLRRSDYSLTQNKLMARINLKASQSR